MDDTKKPQRRLVLPEKKTKVALQLNGGPADISVESIMQDALQIASIEMAKYRTKVGRGNTLDLKESRIIQGWIKSMTDLMKEHREQERASDLSKLSTEELALLAKKVLDNGPSVVEVDKVEEDEETD
jgi:hypothetical protein